MSSSSSLQIDSQSGLSAALPCDVSPLTFLHRRFAPNGSSLSTSTPNSASKEWKHWWAVTEADRLRLRVEIDALCADLYGLDPDDFDWIVRDDPTDPKGFYRVDRQLPFRERLTGLAAAAFRALKEGKWSAEIRRQALQRRVLRPPRHPRTDQRPGRPAKGLPGPLIASVTAATSGSPRTSPPTTPPRLDLGRLLERCRRPARQRGGGAYAAVEESRKDGRVLSRDDAAGVFRLEAKESPKSPRRKAALMANWNPQSCRPGSRR